MVKKCDEYICMLYLHTHTHTKISVVSLEFFVARNYGKAAGEFPENFKEISGK